MHVSPSVCMEKQGCKGSYLLFFCVNLRYLCEEISRWSRWFTLILSSPNFFRPSSFILPHALFLLHHSLFSFLPQGCLRQILDIHYYSFLQATTQTIWTSSFPSQTLPRLRILRAPMLKLQRQHAGRQVIQTLAGLLPFYSWSKPLGFFTFNGSGI